MKPRIIGVDLGTKTLGLAISDRLGLAAHPLATFRFPRGDYQSAKRYLGQLADQEQVATIAIGYPLHMSGASSERSESVLRFKSEFELEYPNIKLELVDERLTTLMANKMMIGAELKASHRREVIDSAAAVLILESYMQRSK
ncbi:MAG TPA: Holliday junction resolvase RuvX [Bacilli bacterium]|nr:Holliday junction resolvase RuvX [Bacilli bacterium]